MKNIFSFITAVFLMPTSWSLAESPMQRLEARASRAVSILDDYSRDDVTRIPDALLREAQCIYVVPSIVKVGFIFGVKTGQGLLSCRTGSGWSMPSFTNITGGSIGFQAGVSVTDLVLVFTNRDAVELLSRANLTLGGSLAVVVGPLGRDVQAGTEGFKSAVYSYSRSQGLYAGVSLDGSAIAPSVKDNRRVYGAEMDALDLLTRFDAFPPPIAREFMDRLERYSPMDR